MLAFAQIIHKMASQQVSDTVVADALERLLSERLASASAHAVSAMYSTAEKQCATQAIFCRATLLLEQTQKKRFIRQLQKEVDSIGAKLLFLDSNVIEHVELYDNFMATGVDLTDFALLNEERKTTLSPV